MEGVRLRWEGCFEEFGEFEVGAWDAKRKWLG